MENQEGKIFYAMLFVVAVIAAIGGFFAAQYSVDIAHAEYFPFDKLDNFERSVRLAQEPFTELRQAGVGYTGDAESGKMGGEPKDLRLIVFEVVRILLGVVGTALVVLIMYAGYLWWSAGGSDEKVTKAKAVLRNAIIGLIIIMMSYAFVSFVIGQLFSSDYQRQMPQDPNFEEKTYTIP